MSKHPESGNISKSSVRIRMSLFLAGTLVLLSLVVLNSEKMDAPRVDEVTGNETNTHKAKAIEPERQPSLALPLRAKSDEKTAEIPAVHFDPHGLYEKHLDVALKGNSDSQYILAMIFRYCSSAPISKRGLERLKTSSLTPGQQRHFRARYEICTELREKAGGMEDGYEQWLAAAREAQHPLALLEGIDGKEVDRRRYLVAQALKSDFDDPILRSETFRQAAGFYSFTPGYEHKIRREAWMLLYCRERDRCPEQRHLAYISKYFLKSQTEEIVNLASRLENHILRQEWSDLGFGQ